MSKVYLKPLYKYKTILYSLRFILEFFGQFWVYNILYNYNQPYDIQRDKTLYTRHTNDGNVNDYFLLHIIIINSRSTHELVFPFNRNVDLG